MRRVPPLAPYELAEYDQAYAMCGQYIDNLVIAHCGEVSDGVPAAQVTGALAAVLCDQEHELTAFTLAVAIARLAGGES